MDKSSLEKLVLQITEEVLAKIQDNPAQPSAGASQQRPVRKKIITEMDVKMMAQTGVKTIRLPEKAILTPAAKDVIRQRSLKVTFSENGSNLNPSNKAVAVFAPHCSQKAKLAYKEIIEASGLKPEMDSESFVSASMSARKAIQLVTRVSNGELRYAIILDVNAFELCAQANQKEGVKAVICWDARSAQESIKSFAPNVLFLHNELIEFKVLCEIIKIWLLRNPKS
jgi:ribose 5-phosphate isomerase RpiB